MIFLLATSTHLLFFQVEKFGAQHREGMLALGFQEEEFFQKTCNLYSQEQLNMTVAELAEHLETEESELRSVFLFLSICKAPTISFGIFYRRRQGDEGERKDSTTQVSCTSCISCADSWLDVRAACDCR